MSVQRLIIIVLQFYQMCALLRLGYYGVSQLRCKLHRKSFTLEAVIRMQDKHSTFKISLLKRLLSIKLLVATTVKIS